MNAALDRLVEVFATGIHVGAIGAVAAIVFLFGVLWHHAGLLVGGAVALCFVLRRVSKDENNPEATTTEYRQRRRQHDRGPATKNVADENSHENTNGEADFTPRLNRAVHNGLPRNTDALVDELLATGRYALLLRPETKKHLNATACRAGNPPAGRGDGTGAGRPRAAWASSPSNRIPRAARPTSIQSCCNATWSTVAPAYLDRFCVTNEQYQQFVDAGGYEQLEFWHEEALPALLDFVDQTGAPGPRYLVRRPVSQRRTAAAGGGH